MPNLEPIPPSQTSRDQTTTTTTTSSTTKQTQTKQKPFWFHFIFGKPDELASIFNTLQNSFNDLSFQTTNVIDPYIFSLPFGIGDVKMLFRKFRSGLSILPLTSTLNPNIVHEIISAGSIDEFNM